MASIIPGEIPCQDTFGCSVNEYEEMSDPEAAVKLLAREKSVKTSKTLLQKAHEEAKRLVVTTALDKIPREIAEKIKSDVTRKPRNDKEAGLLRSITTGCRNKPRNEVLELLEAKLGNTVYQMENPYAYDLSDGDQEKYQLAWAILCMQFYVYTQPKEAMNLIHDATDH